MKRIAIVTCLALAAVFLFAFASQAFADTSGTIYGKAILEPYAVVITGGGTDSGDPLTYEGQLGHFVYEKYGTQTTITNAGTQHALMQIESAQAPTAGSDVWTLDDGSSGNAGWFFGDGSFTGAAVPSGYQYFTNLSRLVPDLAPGSSDVFWSGFTFPTTTGSTADHYMTATVSALPIP